MSWAFECPNPNSTLFRTRNTDRQLASESGRLLPGYLFFHCVCVHMCLSVYMSDCLRVICIVYACVWYVCVCVCVYTHHLCVLCMWRSEDSLGLGNLLLLV